jgi:Secretion system C-terminal sorting domain
MKTTFLILWLTILSLFGQAQTNVYYPFPTLNTVWREGFGGLFCPYCSDYQDLLTGDTLIGSHIYSKITRTAINYYVDYYGYCTGIIIGSGTYYNGAFRNDSINKKVYYVPPSSINDTLLYDFNLNLYDTLHQSYLYDSSTMTMCFVDEIDSVLIGSKYHKEFRIANGSIPPYLYLIEGIGSSSGLLAHLHPIFECGDDLKCVIENGVTIYPDSTYSCQLVDGGSEIICPIFLFKINPNPVSDWGVLNLSPPVNNLELSITNALGIEIERIYNLKNDERIDLSKFQSGLYLYKVIKGTTIVSNGKLIKIK